MRIPSVKTIQRIGCTEETAAAVRELMLSYRDRHPFHRPCPTITMGQIDEIIGTYGVESIPQGSNRKSPAITYCNTGDTYDCTVLWYRGNFHIGNWGDIVERGSYQ